MEKSINSNFVFKDVSTPIYVLHKKYGEEMHEISNDLYLIIGTLEICIFLALEFFHILPI